MNEVSVRDVPVAQPAAGEILVASRYSGISAGTEGWGLSNRFTWSPTPFPCVPGYQRTGTVQAIGNGVEGYEIGQAVVAVGGEWDAAAMDGVASFWGGHIAAANAPEKFVYPLPPEVASTDAAHLVVAQVGYNAASRVTLQSNDWVVVYGDGLIGQFAAQAAAARGARVVLVGHREERLSLAAPFVVGTVNSHGGDVVQQVRAITGTETATAILDTVQTPATGAEYLPLLENARGQIVYSGFTPEPTWADMGVLQQRELTTHYVSGLTRPRMEATLELLATKQMQVAPLLSHHVPFREAPAMYRMIQHKSEPFMGITFSWDGA